MSVVVSAQATFTKLAIACRDALYYKTVPFILQKIEPFEERSYIQQKQQVQPLPSSHPRNPDRLFLVYGRGGGADKYAQDIASKMEAQGAAAWMLRFEPLRRRFILTRAKIQGTNSYIYRFPSQYGQLLTHLQALGLSYLHIQHTRYLPYYLLKDLPYFAELLGVPYDYMAHDFLALCPRVHLINKDFHYCGMPQDTRICNECVAANGWLAPKINDVAQFRAMYQQLLQKAAAIMAPSADTAQRYKAILGELPITVTAHDAPVIQPRTLPALGEGEPYTVAVVGRINRYKGAGVLLACARDALERNLPLRFAVIGDCVYGSELESLGVTLTGIYKETALPALLEESRCSLVFLPSVWPETYSYVLSHIWENGYFPVSFDIGAPAERINAARNGMTLPFDMVNSPSLINDALLKAAHAQYQS